MAADGERRLRDGAPGLACLRPRSEPWVPRGSTPSTRTPEGALLLPAGASFPCRPACHPRGLAAACPAGIAPLQGRDVASEPVGAGVSGRVDLAP